MMSDGWAIRYSDWRSPLDRMLYLDEAGQRIPHPFAWAGWGWEGMRPDERPQPALLDKPIGEPAGNIAVFPPQKVAVWIKGLDREGQDKSDWVKNLHGALTLIG